MTSKFLIKLLFVVLLTSVFLTITGCSSHRREPLDILETLPIREYALPPSPTPEPAEPVLPPVRRQRALPPPIHTQEPMPAPVVLATHETDFDTKAKNRATNITMAARSIDGFIVMPGQVFSFNEATGPTDKNQGYKKDIIYIKGEKKKGYGGGVCQVSTTLYNAAEAADMKIIERHDHSRPVTYAEPGKEAATSYGGIDFKFKNDKPYPIVINCTAVNGKIHASISKLAR